LPSSSGTTRPHPPRPPGWEGTFLLIFALTVTWIGDSCAYFGGRALREAEAHPLGESQAKTVEGADLGTGGLHGREAPSSLPWHSPGWGCGSLSLTVAAAAVLALLVSAVAQVGDLAASLLKREAGVKDSGRILPGHGGVLDRFDGVLFTLPVVYVLLPLFLGWGS
jgi:phosphatidate cytidylyltransferase